MTTIAECLVAARNQTEPVHSAPVNLTATVTLIDRNRGLVVLQDASGAMGISLPATNFAALRVGQKINLETAGLLRYYRPFPEYPDQPNENGWLNSFETPSGRGTYYLTRIRGYLHPPVTGQYTFWTAADDASEFYLSRDASPERLQKIAGNRIGNPTGVREWTRYASQQSPPVTLTGGERYYVEALYIQSYGRDCMAVAWEGPGLKRAVIEERFLTPWREAFSEALRSAKDSLPANGLLWESWTNFFVRDFEALRALRPQESIIRIRSPKLSVVKSEEWPVLRQIDPDMSLDEVPNLAGVELEGEVTFVARSEGGLQFELKRENSMLRGHVIDPKEFSTEKLLHSRVRVRGVLQHTYGSTGILNNSVLWVTSDRQIKLLESQERQAALLDQVPICEIESSNSEMRWGRRVMVRGRITQQTTNGQVILQGYDNYQAVCSEDGTNWVSLGKAVEIRMSNSVLAGVVVLSRHDTEQATASFAHLNVLGANWQWSGIGNPGRVGSFSRGADILTVTGSGRRIGERGDQLYYLWQPLSDESELGGQLIDFKYLNPRAQAGLMIRASLDQGAPFAAVLFAKASGPAFLYRQTLRDPTTGFEPKPEYHEFRWLKLIKRKSLLQVQGEAGPMIGANQEVDVTGIITWRDNKPVLIEPVFESVKIENRLTQPVGSEFEQAIADFVARVLHPPEPFFAGNINSARLHGIVTYCGDYLGQQVIFVQAEDGSGIRVGWSDASLRPRFVVGQLVEMRGTAVGGKFPVVLEPSELNVTGWGTFPKPVPYSFALVKSDGDQARWVEATGVVRSVETNGMINLMTRGGSLAVWVGRNQTTNAGRFFDSLVRLRGVLSLDSARAAQLLVPSAEFVEVLERAPADPFAIPRFSIAELARSNVKPEQLRRMKLGGVVSCVLTNGIYVQDETGGAFVQTDEANDLRAGDRIEVVGFPHNEAGVVMLSGVSLHKAGAGDHLKAIRIGVEERDETRFAGMLVQTEAKLLDQHNTWGGQVLALRTGPKIFEAELLYGNDGKLPAIPNDSRLAITGICQVVRQTALVGVSGMASDKSPGTLKILLRSPFDVYVLERPPWWNLKRVAWLGGLFALGLLVALIWVRLLRRRVVQRTRQLQATMKQLEKETRASAVLAERDRLAGEIHDSLEQGLSAIMLQLDAASKHADQSLDSRKFVRMARNMAAFSRTEVQHAVWDMQSPLLANADLGTALKHVATLISSGAPEIKIEIVGPPRSFPPTHEHHLLRIAQEAITNAVKHAQARNVNVTLDYAGADFKLTISDDGGGFVPSAVKRDGQSGHFGLHSMRARAENLAAQLEVTSEIGKGTIITVKMSLNGERRAATSNEQSAP